MKSPTGIMLDQKIHKVIAEMASSVKKHYGLLGVHLVKSYHVVVCISICPSGLLSFDAKAFEYTEQLTIFDSLNIQLYHGMLPHTQPPFYFMLEIIIYLQVSSLNY